MSGSKRWRFVRAARRALRRVVDPLPLTPLGALVGAGAWLGLERGAFAQLDLVLLVVGYGALGLLGLSVILTAIAAAWVRLRLREEPREEALVLETGAPGLTGFAVPSLSLWPLVSARWAWVTPAAQVSPVRRGTTRLERVTFSERGEVRRVHRRIVVGDAFGLARVGLHVRRDTAIDVLPSAGALEQLPVLASMAGGDDLPHPMGVDDGARVELRRYAPGDPARFIHWKVFARTRELVVRVPERALTRARRTIAYLVAGDDDDASAGAARVAVERDAFGGEWVFGADGSSDDARTPRAALALIVRSAGRGGGVGLSTFLERAERAGPATAVIFAPPRPGPWVDRVVVEARRRRGRVRVVVAVDGTSRAAPRAWWRRALAAAAPSDGTPAESLESVLTRLAEARCELLVLDRRTGRVLGERHRAAMRRMQGRAA